MKFIYVLSLSFLLIGCSSKMSSEELAKELGPKIVKHICEEMKIDEEKVKLKEFSLMNESGNKYAGILKTTYDGLTQTFDVDVTYDGKDYQYTWELISEK